MSLLASKSYTFNPRPRYPLLLSVKRYWDPSSPHLNDPDALTLVFTHGTGFHKELYEPTIAELYARLGGAAGPKIREVWSIDAPNHGDAAVLNEHALRDGYDDEPVFGWQEYARGLHAFLAGLGTGVDVDFRTRRLVLVGHSMSCPAIILALTYQPALAPAFLVMVEMMGINPQAVPALMKFLTDGSAHRRDVWPSRADAYRLLKARPPWRAWDDRVLRIFVEAGLRPLPTLEYPDTDTEGVTLKCTRLQETATYRDSLASAVAYHLMRLVVKRFPTHFIQGAVDDYLSRAVKDDFLDNAVGGAHNLASLACVPGAGHLVVQTHPAGLAEALFDVLKMESEGAGVQVKL
ncbi:Alpha/beta hydrolase fold-1 [Mycena rosella]|uniref:Alpha/beta hydrolase fold-1 n=1 Tax=Mycena rosella TaxID=1033263 RepID=A0AAD7C9W4_MYCRO|nr:Alpha/beta hydrolase fold-1 [Mycena rosella]